MVLGNNTAVVNCLGAAAAWSPFKIAVVCWLHAAAAQTTLKLGKIDPGLCTLTELMTTATSAASALWPGSAAVCPLTATLATDSLSGWSPLRHFLFHGGVRIIVHTVLLVSERLRRRHYSGPTTSQNEHQQPSVGLSVLPSELWLIVCGNLGRGDWAVPQRREVRDHTHTHTHTCMQT